MNVVDDDGYTLLRRAVKRRQARVVAQLLAVEGIDINAGDRFGDTALHLAAASGQAGIVDQLLAAGANVCIASSWFGDTPLHLAARNGHHEVVAKLLISHPRGIHSINDLQLNALQLAAQHGHTETVVVLLTARQNPDYFRDALYEAAKEGKDEVVERVLKMMSSDLAKSFGVKAFHAAARGGHCNILTLFLAASPDIIHSAIDRHTALHAAAHDGNDRVVALLLAASPDLSLKVTEKGWTALHIAAFGGASVNVAQMLLAAKPELLRMRAKNNETLLHAAIRGRNMQLVEMFWERLDDDEHTALRAETSNGATPFHFALRHNFDEAIEFCQWKLSCDDILRALSTTPESSKRFMGQFVPILEQQCNPLLIALHRDVANTVIGYLGLDSRMFFRPAEEKETSSSANPLRVVLESSS